MGVQPENYLQLAEKSEEYWWRDDIQVMHISEQGAQITFGDDEKGWYWEEKTAANYLQALPEETGYAKLLGASQDGSRLYFETNGEWQAGYFHKKTLLELDMTTGQTWEAEYPEEFMNVVGCWDDKLLYSVRDDRKETATVYSWDPHRGKMVRLAQTLPCAKSEKERMEIPSNLRNLGRYCKLDVSKRRLLMPYYQRTAQGETLTLLEINPETGKSRSRDISWMLPEVQPEKGWPDNGTYYLEDSTGILGFLDEGTLYVMDEAGNRLFTVSGTEEGTEINSFNLFPDGETGTVSYKNGQIEFYRLADGQKTGTLDLKSYSTTLSTPVVTAWEWTKEGRLLAYADDETFLLDVSDGTAQVAAVIPSCVAYDPYGNRYLTLDHDDGIGQLNCLSVEELVAWGEKLLGR